MGGITSQILGLPSSPPSSAPRKRRLQSVATDKQGREERKKSILEILAHTTEMGRAHRLPPRWRTPVGVPAYRGRPPRETTREATSGTKGTGETDCSVP